MVFHHSGKISGTTSSNIISLHFFFPLLLEFPLDVGLGHGLTLSSMPLKLCDRHYQMFPTSLSLERLPAKFREWEMLYAYFLKLPCSWCGHITEYYQWAGGTLGRLLVSFSKGEDVRHLFLSLLPPSCPADRSDVWSLVVMFNHRETSMRAKNQQIKDVEWREETLWGPWL